jgi:hypothetical protein
MRWVDIEPLSNTVLKSPLSVPGLTRGSPRLSACGGDHPAMRTYPYNRDTQRIEDLGDRTIQSIPVKGCRVTTSIPGDPASNRSADTIIDEVWTSAEMGMGLLKTHQDEGTKEDEIVEVDNLVRGEPDSALFKPPSDYKVRDMQEERLKAEQSQIPVTHPELLSGLWEIEDPGSGVIDGIALSFLTNVRAGTAYMQGLVVKGYRTQSQQEQRGFFATGHDGTTWDGKRLQIKSLDLEIDLTFDPEALQWSGTYSRNGVAKMVRLQRPGVSAAPSSPFVGNWCVRDACLNLAQRKDGSFLDWRNWRVVPSNAPEVGSYGQELAITDINTLSISLTTNTPGSPVGNVLTFAGTLSSDGSSIDVKQATLRDNTAYSKNSGDGFPVLSPR